MKSITDLNGIGLNTTDYTDNRDPSVTFTTLYPTSQSLTVYQGAAHTLPVASDITEIINFSQAAVSYIIDLRSTLLDCTVQWTTIPAGCTLTNPAHNVWKISGINSVATWNTIKNPTITINENVLTDISYLVTIEYLTTKYVSWNVNIHTLLYDILSDGTTFYFEDGAVQLITNGPNVFDYRATQSTWTVTITPDDLTVLTDIYTSGIGGTSTVNPTTKVVTISGTKAQVNSHLDNLYMNFPANNTLDMNLTYFAINGTGTLSMSKIQPLVCNTVRYLGFSGSDNYAEDTSFTLSGLPLITNYATSTYEGNEPKTLNIIDTLYDLTATGAAFSGNVVFSPSYTPAVGTGCFAFDPANDGYLYAQNTNVGQMGSGDSTVELWFKPMTGSMTGTLHGIINKRNFSSVGAGTWGLGFNGSTNSLYFSEMPNVPGITTLTTATNTITRGSWQHIAVVRYNGTIKIYINGNLKATSASTSTVDYSTNGESVRIGDWDSSGSNQLQNAFVDEIRVSTTARYTTTFTPSTTAFTTDPYTTLLMHFEENARYDTSGSVSVNTLVKKLGTAALWFNRGALTANTSYDWNWYASDYTCELFVYKTATSPVIYPLEIGLKESTGTLNCWSFGIDNSNKCRLYYYDGSERHVIGTSTLALNTWHHLAFTFTKKTNQIKLFVNGVAETTFKVTGNPLYYNTVLLNLGKYANNSFSGYMDEVRISKTVRYTNNFTPPTTAFTVDNYTNFLLHGDGYNGSVISDSSTAITGANYTYTITPSDTAAWRNISSSGVGGTFTTNNNVITITGNKQQVNNRLSTITLRPASDYTSSYTITANATMPEGVQKSRTYGLNCLYVHDEVSNISLNRAITYDQAGTLIFATNTPQITDLDETNPTYSIFLFTSYGKFGTTTANAVQSYTYTGTKAQINALFPTILFIPNSGVYGSIGFAYSQLKGSISQVQVGATLIGPTYVYTPTTMPAYTSGTIPEGYSSTYTHPMTVTYLNNTLTAVVQPTNIVLGSGVADFSWTVTWADTTGMTVTKVGNVYTITGIDTIAKWNAIKTFTYKTNTYYNGTYNLEFNVTSPFVANSGKYITVTEEYPLSTLTNSSYNYTAGTAFSLTTQGLRPTLVDSGETTYIWTVTLAPSMSITGTTLLSYTYSTTGGGTVTVTGDSLVATGTVTQINAILTSISVTVAANKLIDFVMTYTASNSTTTETATRTFTLTNIESTFIGLTRATETFSTGVSTAISNGPLVTETGYTNYNLVLYPNDTTYTTTLTAYNYITAYGIKTEGTGYSFVQGPFPYQVVAASTYRASALSGDGTVFAVADHIINDGGNSQGMAIISFFNVTSTGALTSKYQVAFPDPCFVINASSVVNYINEPLTIALSNSGTTIAIGYKYTQYDSTHTTIDPTFVLYDIILSNGSYVYSYNGFFRGNSTSGVSLLQPTLDRDQASRPYFRDDTMKMSPDGTTFAVTLRTVDQTSTQRSYVFYCRKSATYTAGIGWMTKTMITLPTSPWNYYTPIALNANGNLLAISYGSVVRIYNNGSLAYTSPTAAVTSGAMLRFNSDTSLSLIAANTGNYKFTYSGGAWTMTTYTDNGLSSYYISNTNQYGDIYVLQQTNNDNPVGQLIPREFRIYKLVSNMLTYIKSITTTTSQPQDSLRVFLPDTPYTKMLLNRYDTRYTLVSDQIPTRDGTTYTSDPSTKKLTISGKTPTLLNAMIDDITMTSSITSNFELLYEVTNVSTGTVKTRNQFVNKV